MDRIDRWLAEARLFSAIVAAARDFRDHTVRPGDHWREVARAAGHRQGPRFAPLVLMMVLARYVTPHVRVFASVRGGIAVESALEVRLGGGSLRGALCSELLLEVQGREHVLVRCSGGCDRFTRKARATDKRSFCRPCRKAGASVRLAMRDYRARVGRADGA